MSAKATVLLLLCAFVALLAPAAPAAQQPSPAAPGAPIAFVNASVIPMDREQVLSDHTVVVAEGRISAMGPSAKVQVPAGAHRIEARGQFLLPALAEMHAHIPPGDDVPDAEIERVLFLYAANGIGTIRGMLGHPRHLPLRERANRGEIVSPWIYTSGTSVNGKTAPTPEAAVKLVAEQKAAGYDFMKIHPGVPRDAFDAMAAEAHKVGFRFAGHVPAAVGIERALQARIWTVDHVDGYVEALAGSDAGPSQAFGLNLVGKVDRSRLPKLVDATRAAGTSIVPTEALLTHWVSLESPEQMRKWPEMRFVPPKTLDQWSEAKRKITSGVSEEDRKQFLALRREIMQALRKGGVKFLLGSDAPQTWNVPGFAIHRELEYMLEAGFTPYQALETGTRLVAEHFGTSGERGTITEGKRADLVLLGGNPLQDIRNTQKVQAVVLGGRLLTQAEIDKRLEGYAKH
jgi:hypothetical protein